MIPLACAHRGGGRRRGGPELPPAERDVPGRAGHLRPAGLRPGQMGHSADQQGDDRPPGGDQGAVRRGRQGQGRGAGFAGGPPGRTRRGSRGGVAHPRGGSRAGRADHRPAAGAGSGGGRPGHRQCSRPDRGRARPDAGAAQERGRHHRHDPRRPHRRRVAGRRRAAEAHRRPVHRGLGEQRTDVEQVRGVSASVARGGRSTAVEDTRRRSRRGGRRAVLGRRRARRHAGRSPHPHRSVDRSGRTLRGGGVCARRQGERRRRWPWSTRPRGDAGPAAAP